MAKRDLFNELMEGFDALKTEREGKITLRTTEIDIPGPIEMSPRQIARIREEHNYSQAVFARMLSTKVSTPRNWEQGRSEPNAQAKLLLKLVDTAPDVLAALARVTTGPAAVKANTNPGAKSQPKRRSQLEGQRRKELRDDPLSPDQSLFFYPATCTKLDV